jgi:hypothetical protein
MNDGVSAFHQAAIMGFTGLVVALVLLVLFFVFAGL